jgi:hypothetical protein
MPAAQPTIRVRVARLLGVHEWLLMALLAIWTFAPVVWLLTRTHSGDLYTGADGPFAGDALQYLSWIRESGTNLLVANRFDLSPARHVFLHPLFALSGLLWKAGLPLQAAYLAWKPVAVVSVVAAVAAYARRLLPGRRRDQAVALALGLFLFPPSVALLSWLPGHPSPDLIGVGGEISIAAQTWGASPILIAVALMPAFLLTFEKLVDPRRRSAGRGPAWYAGWAAGIGLLVSWIHPWQGETLLLVLAAVLPWLPRGRRRAAALPALALALPLAYYLGLQHFADAWRVAERQNEMPPDPPAGVLLALAPIAVLALAGVRRGPRDVQERALLAWPVAALAVHFFLSPTVPGHAFEGMSIPLAVLAARGVQRLALPLAATAALVALLVVPGLEVTAKFMHDEATSGREPHTVGAPEARALRYLQADGRPGGVLTTSLLGAAVPAYAGRSTWAGHASWTPDSTRRFAQADDLFSARMSPGDAGRLIRASGAAFVVSPCGARLDAARALAGSSVVAHRFGCAVVYEVPGAAR